MPRLSLLLLLMPPPAALPLPPAATAPHHCRHCRRHHHHQDVHQQYKLVERWFIHQRGEVEDNRVDGKVIYSDQVGVPDNWQGQRQWAAMKTTAATAIAVGTDKNQLKGPAVKTLAATTVTAAEKATVT
jgi:hypothetical protein